MEPSTGVIVACLIFVAVIIAVNATASVLRDRSRDDADVEKKKAEAEVFKDLSDKLVQTMQAMSGTGLANNAIRTIIDQDPNERVGNGRTGVPYQPRDNGQYRPDGSFARPATTEAASH